MVRLLYYFCVNVLNLCIMKIRELDTLSFLYDPDHFSWFRRHVLNHVCKKEIRTAMRSGAKVVVANGKVAEELHRYYRVPYDMISIL